ncbi:multiple monosaccharide ABC transporter substrate-binding protein [Actinomyces ruminicola]|uniref:Monosaccharide ABC transporter substrate-binding protein, CUT2 family n=1 Tax=Actinomyces ruminicola TaxID=332524 RepID=A0A1G9YK60_9ACTO|nr:multiple monosaccharide ABC transporter substrate-binding protein [Actinomyces ruminicola]SDN08873.1 monosaccharide ABC transporter substrate-binding protein, CUT2 family [Actinomyces ruminicola]SDN30855.1 monosaccharide ABC transporter substrate-binding protein, CUT2 family [Actinomyces ruminicola]
MSRPIPTLSRRAVLAGGVTAAVATALAACGGSGAAGGAGSDTAGKDPSELKIGVAMPTKSSERWIKDGSNIKAQLEKLGYNVDLQFAEDDIPTQANQIDNMITQGVNLLIIAPIDGTALSGQLDSAGEAGITVISYDRLIRDNENVSYYTSFDNYDVGTQMGTSLLIGMGVLDADGNDAGLSPDEPYNIELFGGSPDDNNSPFFFNGAMDVIQPYIDSGVINVKSGQTEFGTVATMRWDAATAQSRMDNLITSTYSDGSRVDGVLSPLDSMSIGILGALKGAGYGTDAQPYPTVTGQDAEVAGIKSIMAGEQYSTIFKDTRDLADAAVQMAVAVLGGEEPEVNDTETYDNGVKVVPSYLLKSEIITKDNVQSSLIDTGYLSEDEIK